MRVIRSEQFFKAGLMYVYVMFKIRLSKHSIGRAGVPMEVMGLMLGQFVDDYTVRVIDVFAMPQSGTVSQ